MADVPFSADESKIEATEEKERHPEVKAALSALLDRIPGSKAFLVCSADGVPLIEVFRDAGLSDDPEVGLSAALGVAMEQVEKLSFGSLKTVSAFYNGDAVLHINASPLVLCLIGSATCNLGIALDLEDSLRACIEPVRAELEKHFMDDMVA